MEVHSYISKVAAALGQDKLVHHSLSQTGRVYISHRGVRHTNVYILSLKSLLRHLAEQGGEAWISYFFKIARRALEVEVGSSIIHCHNQIRGGTLGARQEIGSESGAV